MGPLAGKKIIELKGIGPGPYAGMIFADLGAEVVVVERSSGTNPFGLPSKTDVHSRGKKSIALNLKTPEGVESLLRMVESADAIFEGFRPGVAEKLGIGPDVCLKRNPKIVYGRITGWGQEGPLAHSAGHDLNYISLSGIAAAIGSKEQPMPPLNLLGDFAAGSLFLVVGMLSALIESAQSGKGQVIDAAIVDGSSHMMSFFYTLSNLGSWNTTRQSNMLDGGSPYYRAYETQDGKHISLAAIEPHFFKEMIAIAELPEEFTKMQNKPEYWPEMTQILEDKFKQKTRDEWASLFEGSDACVAGVYDYKEAHTHTHNVERNAYIDVDGQTQPAPAPRFSRSECQVTHAGHAEGADTKTVLKDWGFSESEISQLDDAGALS